MNVNKEDNLEQSNKSEVNPDQQGQETVTQATQHQVRFRSTNTQELSTGTHQEPAKINRMRKQRYVEAQNQQIATNTITQVPTMSKTELAMYHHINHWATPGKIHY